MHTEQSQTVLGRSGPAMGRSPTDGQAHPSNRRSGPPRMAGHQPNVESTMFVCFFYINRFPTIRSGQRRQYNDALPNWYLQFIKLHLMRPRSQDGPRGLLSGHPSPQSFQRCNHFPLTLVPFPSLCLQPIMRFLFLVTARRACVSAAFCCTS